ncbi:MAG TPA: BON domain-containing protein [Dictyobacter sp.]|jgi:osmotically-inducible protein OsmY|nr:BON domain-containing protein [Dictyobacter sp.]
MEKQTRISEMEKYHFGSKVICSDGDEGVLTQISFATGTRTLSGISVRLGRFFGRTVYLPISAVVDASSDGVMLNITGEQLAASSASSEGVHLDNKSSVVNASPSAHGVLELLAVHPDSREIGYLVARHFRSGQDALIRGDFVKSIDNGRIEVSISEASFHTLPPYRSDNDIQNDVEQILNTIIPLHVDYPGMSIRVLDSVLYLEGNISSSLRGDMVEDVTSGVSGLLETKNLLVGDDSLANDLANALGRDERTRDLPIGVYPRLGVVRLSGAVHNEKQKKAAEEVAQGFAGVHSVTNDLVVNPRADLLNVMASSAGGDAIDRVPGKYIRHTR